MKTRSQYQRKPNHSFDGNWMTVSMKTHRCLPQSQCARPPSLRTLVAAKSTPNRPSPSWAKHAWYKVVVMLINHISAMKGDLHIYISMTYWVQVWGTLLSTCCLLNIKSWPCIWWLCPQVDTGDLAQGLRLCLCCKNLFYIFERFLISSFLYAHLVRATQLEEYSRILCPTLGAPDNTWQPAQSVTKWVIWSNNLEINYK